jgi:amidase
MFSNTKNFNPVMGWKEWSNYDAMGLAKLVQSKQVTPQELARQTVRAVQILNPRLEAILEIFEDAVDNPNIDSPNCNGSLYGVPFFLKDITAKLKGRLHEQGSKLFKGYVAQETDPLVENFLQAGFIILGRSTVPEMGFAFDTSTSYLGKVTITRNPWGLEYTAGGSSGGAGALVAAGMTPVSMSSDGAGSTRFPAAFNGLIGLKATRGRLPPPRQINEYINPSSAPGVLTRTVRDWAVVLDYIARVPNGGSFMKVLPFDRSYLEAIVHSPTKLHIAISTGLWGCPDPTDQQITARTQQVAHVLEDLGHIVEEVEDKAICDFNIARKTSQINWIRSAGEIRLLAQDMKILPEELCNYLEPMTYKHFKAADQYNKYDLWRSSFVNPRITRSFGQFFEKYDALLTPTSAIRVPKAAGPYSLLSNKESINVWLERVFSAARYTYPANDTGLPAISIPAGLDEDGLPIGAQLYANFLREDLLIQLAWQLEQAKPEWFNQIPPYHISKII